MKREPLYQFVPAEFNVPKPRGSFLSFSWADPHRPETWACAHGDKVFPGHTVVYQIYDSTRQIDEDAETVLYVGVTDNVARRFTQHRYKKPWWHEADQIYMDCYVNRELALADELVYIQYGSLYNIVGRSI